MSETSKPRVERAADPAAEPDRTDALEYAVVENGDGPAECTVYPRDCAEEDLMTRWLTAREGAYVSLTEMC